MNLFFLLFLIVELECYVEAENRVPLAGFFHTENSEQELVFKFAIKSINSGTNILAGATLIPNVEHVSTFDSYNTSRRVCDLVQKGIGGIFGPHSQETSGIVHSLSDTLDVPFIQTSWDFSNLTSTMGVNLFPDPQLFAKALVAVIEDMDWKSYAIIYENNDSLIRLHELIKAHERAYTLEGHVPFTVWQLDSEGDHRPLLKEIQKTAETHIILDCSTDTIIDILHQAREVKMTGDYHSYVLTSLDAHTIDFGDFKLGPTNITTVRLIDPQKYKVQAAVQDLFGSKSNRTLKTASALMYDAVQVYAKALNDTGPDVRVSPIDCFEDNNKWEFGSQVISKLKNIELDGMTGKIKFDENGRRNFFVLDITELTKNGFRKIGSWDPVNRMTYTRTKSEMDVEMYQSIGNKTFLVVSRIGRPYLSIKDEGATGNERFEGYSLDVIDEISKHLNFKYKFYLAPDGEYGSFNRETKQWTGLIKELRERRADLAICDLTITYERRSAVDFTKPFMTLGISILYSKAAKQPPELFSFLNPFSIDVWMYMATAYLGVSLLLYFLSRCTPDEWENPHPCNPDPTELECTFSLHNCLWFSIGSLMAQGCDLLPKISPEQWKNPHPCNPFPEELENNMTMQNCIWHNIGSLMQQGSDIAPQSISTRIVAGMWWFFVLIMISSYTANLAAFLTMNKMETSIKSVEDLANQNKIKYGVYRSGSSAKFFKDSNVSLYQRIWSAMESARPSVFTDDNDEGVDRVLKGNRGYAFFMESTSIEYQVEKHCELTQVGGLLDNKGYGIAMPFNSPYRIAISGAVLRLQESGKLAELKDKWWKKSHGKPSCADTTEEVVDSDELGIDNVGGVFLVLIVGCAAAFFVSILEFLWNVRKVAVEEKISPKEALLLELRFALQCYGTTKPVRKKSVTEENEEGEEEEEEEQEEDYYGAVERAEDVFIRMNGFDDYRGKSPESDRYTR